MTQCGNILIHGTCLKCNSGYRNSFTYDPIPESFDEVQIIPNPPPQCHFSIYLCQICESNSHYGYECLQRVTLVYEPEPCYTQKFSDNDYSHDLPGVNPLIDHLCCYKCGNSLNDFFCHQCTCEFCGNGAHVGYNCPAQVPSIQTLPSFPQQYPCCEDCWGLPEADHCQPPQYTVNHLIFNAHNNLINSQNKLMEQLTSMCDMERSNSLKDNIISGLPPCAAITPISSTEKPVDSLIMEDEHLDIVLATKSDELIKSSVENLVPNPSESEGEHECDVSACDDFTTFSNLLFDVDDDFSSNSSIISSSSKIDYLLDEFAGELALLKSVPPGIDKADSDPEEEICLIKRLLYNNSSPQIDLSFTPDDPMPLGIKEDDYDSERDFLILEELLSNKSLSLPDDPMPLGIKEDDYDSERDFLILEELLSNNSLSLPENESFHFDIPSSSRPPTKPPDGNTGILNIKMMGDISEQKPSYAECSMMIYGKNTPNLDVLSSIHGNLKTLAKGFYPPSLYFLSFNWESTVVVRTQAQHGEAIRGMHEQLLGVPIQEELTALRFRVDVAEAENASLRDKIKTTKAIEKITCSQERRARMEMKRQLASVQESQQQDRENFKKFQKLHSDVYVTYFHSVIYFVGHSLKVMAAPTIAISTEENLRDPIDIRWISFTQSPSLQLLFLQRPL
uniref:Reverse transcriptase domain-containing protein n=1 Tax=Tanacetum cinerariifolium TaxID=118510 RepID=A0A6L2K6K5_TANCI|nr:hypothetical protein [Tanacetum cinerariifolium]